MYADLRFVRHYCCLEALLFDGSRVKTPSTNLRKTLEFQRFLRMEHNIG